MYEAEVEATYWEKRNAHFAFLEIKKNESQRFQLHQASRDADQAQREREREKIRS